MRTSIYIGAVLLSSALIASAQPQNSPAPAAQPSASTVTAPVSVPSQPSPSMSGIEVSRAAIALNVADNEPENPDSIFPPEVKRLFCFTQIKGVKDSIQVEHRWYWNDDMLLAVPLTIKSGNWRTYSQKSIPAGMKGEWRVAVVNTSDKDAVLKMLKFTVK